ncbi:MAG: PEP-CTERM sorting domain-containing protein [Proteobacteria bacterium]|jgi:hypothetical protein|nr:PEP-CTERM sorting domain-containing protein [Pseudomonadota bacterium]
MKRTLLTAAIALAASAGALAAPTFGLKNLPSGWDGSFEIKFQNMEAFTGDLTSFVNQATTPIYNYGVAKLSSIVDPGSGNTIWADGDNGAEITLIFNNISVKTVTPILGGFQVDSTGGLMSMFINPMGAFSAAGGFAQGLGGYATGGCLINQLCYNGISGVAGGGAFLDLAWAAVGIVADPTVTVHGTFTSLTTPQTGTAQGYLNVTGGPYAANFDTNGQLGGSDLFSQNDFCTPGQIGCVNLAAAGGSPAAGGWPLRSNDPVRGAFVPEPGTLGLVGLALLGIGAGAVRRRRG